MVVSGKQWLDASHISRRQLLWVNLLLSITVIKSQKNPCLWGTPVGLVPRKRLPALVTGTSVGARKSRRGLRVHRLIPAVTTPRLFAVLGSHLASGQGPDPNLNSVVLAGYLNAGGVGPAAPDVRCLRHPRLRSLHGIKKSSAVSPAKAGAFSIVEVVLQTVTESTNPI